MELKNKRPNERQNWVSLTLSNGGTVTYRVLSKCRGVLMHNKKRGLILLFERITIYVGWRTCWKLRKFCDKQ
jgi:hypothetical protein